MAVKDMVVQRFQALCRENSKNINQKGTLRQEVSPSGNFLSRSPRKAGNALQRQQMQRVIEIEKIFQS